MTDWHLKYVTQRLRSFAMFCMTVHSIMIWYAFASESLKWCPKRTVTNFGYSQAFVVATLTVLSLVLIDGWVYMACSCFCTIHKNVYISQKCIGNSSVTGFTLHTCWCRPYWWSSPSSMFQFNINWNDSQLYKAVILDKCVLHGW